jgi:hypothetical protein
VKFEGEQSCIKPGRLNYNLGSRLTKAWEIAKELGCALQILEQNGASLSDAYEGAVPYIQAKYPELDESELHLVTNLLFQHWDHAQRLSDELAMAGKNRYAQMLSRQEQPVSHP